MRIGHRGGAAILVVICACGGKSPSGSENVDRGATLNIAVTGQGTVTSPDGLTCTSQCSRPAKMGTRVHLDAVPAAGMQFMGWSGTCSGTGGCDVDITSETQVGASFAAGKVTIEVRMVGTGSGRVTSAPAGIDCPGTCAMAVDPGMVITMSQTAGSDSSFVGWGGGCSGFSCVVTASAATKPIFANFGGPAPQPTGPCAGISVPAVTAADLKTFDVSRSDMTGCDSAGTDLLGNLYISVDDAGGGSVAFSTGNTVRGFFPMAFLRSGYATFADTCSISSCTDIFLQPVVPYQSHSPQGTVLTSIDIPNGLLASAEDPDGGSVLASGKCDDGGASSTIDLFYFDDANTLTRTAKITGAGCMKPGHVLKVIMDSAGLTLLAYANIDVSTFGVPARRFAARWLDASGSPVTDWFDAGPLLSIGFLVERFIGGGVALTSDGFSWTFFPSGKAQAEPPPPVIGSSFPLLGDAHGQIARILGGKAYGVVSGTTVTVVAPSGEVCGRLPPLGDSNSRFFVGRDGTFIALSGTSSFTTTHHCSASYYPRLLK